MSDQQSTLDEYPGIRNRLLQIIQDKLGSALILDRIPVENRDEGPELFAELSAFFLALEKEPEKLLELNDEIVPPEGNTGAVLSELRAELATQGLSDRLLLPLLRDLLRRMSDRYLRRLMFPTKTGREHTGKDEEAKPEPLPVCIIGGVCSDVHLGTRESKRAIFYAWLKDRKPGETVVLVGDILDFWIFSRHDQGEDFVRRIYAEWQDLWKALAKLNDRGAKVHYIPGNHDSFLFFVEAADELPWCKELLQRTPELLSLRDLSKQYRMIQVASVHYPFFPLNEEPCNILFTHGHYSNWAWRLIGGMISENHPKAISFLTAAAINFAHKNAGILRRTVNEYDWLRRVHGIEDTAINITNAILNAYDGAAGMASNSPERFLDLIDQAMCLYFRGKAPISAAEEIRIRDALLALAYIRQHNPPSQVKQIRESTMALLQRCRDEENVSLHQVGTSRTPATYRDFSSLLTPAKLVFGHYHQARSDENSAFEVGGFVQPVSTSLAIQSDGMLVRDTS